MAIKIYKTVLRVVIYSETPINLDDCGLADLAEGIDTGDEIGGVDLQSQEEITDPARLRAELLEIGNDGEFFQIDGADAPEREDS